MKKIIIVLVAAVAILGCGRSLSTNSWTSHVGYEETKNSMAADESRYVRTNPGSDGSSQRIVERVRVRTVERKGPVRTAGGYPVRQDVSEGYDRQTQSGILTAGSLDDLSNPKKYCELSGWLRWVHNESITSGASDRPCVIRVVDNDGKPIGGVDLKIDGAYRWSTLNLRTKSNGSVVIMPLWDGVKHRKLQVRVTAPGTQYEIEKTIFPMQSKVHTIRIQQARGQAPCRLDMAFAIDCTGSMSDELEYLKVEIKSIAAAVAKRFPQVHQRYGLVVYRDNGDRYVTKSYDFHESIDNFIRILGQQRADGGGDNPEAVDKALSEIADLSWRDGNVARLCFHVADAPPHSNRVNRTLQAVNRLRSKGVGIYPVASSGVKNLAEFMMRTEALLTGSDYLFLTDDSGVGNKHAKPTADRYNVEILKDLMIRMVTQEICGLKLDPRHGDVIRTAWGRHAWQDGEKSSQ